MSETVIVERVRSYPKINALPHAANRDLFLEPVVVQEKVDGSQFSFRVEGGQLMCRSKNVQIPPYPEGAGMFKQAVETALELAPGLHDGWTYRCEYLNKPKHNTLAYDRTPDKWLVLYDIDEGHEAYLSPADVQIEANRIGLECVPTFRAGLMKDAADIRALLDIESMLGGTLVEGVVIKNYRRFGQDGKALMAKIVRADFQEKNQKNQRATNPSGKDIVYEIGESLRTEARWSKAVQHLRENGFPLTNSPKDIGPLLKEINADILSECEDEIKAALFKWAWKDISRMIIRGFPEWYKQQAGC